MLYGPGPSAMQKRCKITRCVYEKAFSYTVEVSTMRCGQIDFPDESDTPGKAGGLMSGAASKAVGP